MVSVKTSGNFNKTESFLKNIKEKRFENLLHRYGRKGVEALSRATPVDTGKTASMWRYELEVAEGNSKITFHNDNVNNYVNIAIILQYGHGTGTGGWVEGRDYINPAIQSVFDELLNDITVEVRGL